MTILEKMREMYNSAKVAVAAGALVATVTTGCGLPSDFGLEAKDSIHVKVNDEKATYSVKEKNELINPYECILRFANSTTLVDRGCDHSVEEVVLYGKKPIQVSEKYDERTINKLNETMKQGHTAAVKAKEKKIHGDGEDILDRVGASTGILEE